MMGVQAIGVDRARFLEWVRVTEAFSRDLATRGYSAFTLRDYRSDVLRLGLELDLSPDDVRGEHLETVEEILVRCGVGKTARRRRLSAFNRFLAYQLTRRALPVAGPSMLRAAAQSSPVDHLLVALVYLGGLRLAEIVHLEGRDVRMKKVTLTSRLGYRLIPMHDHLHRVLGGLRDHQPIAAHRPIMQGAKGFPVNTRTLHGRFQRIAKRAGLVRVKPDVLRRETAAHLIGEGAPRGMVQAWLGNDRGELLAPRKGRLSDLTSLRPRLSSVPLEP